MKFFFRFLLFAAGALSGLVQVSLPAQTSPRISALTPAGLLTWTNSALEHVFRVERATSPLTAWTNLGGTFTSTVPAMSASVPMTNQSNFFRVVDTGSCCTNNGGPSEAAAVNLGSGCGDIGSSDFVRTGCGNAWFKVTISECNLSFASPTPLKVHFTLSVPAGFDYDLAAKNAGGGLNTSQQGGNLTENILLTVPDDVVFATDTDQTYSLWVNVYRFSGVGCANWTLTVHFGP